MSRQMQDMDLTAAQARIVGYLFHHDMPPCARDLEEYFELSHPTVSGLLSRMEAKGFIRMEPDEKDNGSSAFVSRKRAGPATTGSSGALRKMTGG